MTKARTENSARNKQIIAFGICCSPSVNIGGPLATDPHFARLGACVHLPEGVYWIAHHLKPMAGRQQILEESKRNAAGSA